MPNTALIPLDNEELGSHKMIRNVWMQNFETELAVISELLDKYPYVAMVRISLIMIEIGHRVSWSHC